MLNWQAEVEELHAVFQAYFLGTLDTLDRVEAALGNDFTIVGPHGIEASRAETMQALRAGHGHASTLEITVTEMALVVATPEILVARYVENHVLADRTNHRLSTVVFTVDETGPNGLRWQRVHETWVS